MRSKALRNPGERQELVERRLVFRPLSVLVFILQMKEDIQETRLDNGLVILTDRMPGVRSATLGFFFRVGSRRE